MGNPSQSYETDSGRCHSTLVKVLRVNPGQTDRPVLDLPTTERWKDELTRVVGYVPDD